MHHSTYDDLEKAVYRWFVSVRAKNIPILGPVLQEKALQYATELGYDEFHASSGWLHNFKECHNICFKAICGESSAVDTEVVGDWRTQVLPQLLESYPPSAIFNADETGLFIG